MRVNTLVVNARVLTIDDARLRASALAVLSDDPTAVDSAAIAEIRVLATRVGGAVGHDAMGMGR